MKVRVTRFTAILVALALVASGLIGFAIGKVNAKTTTGFKNTASGPPVLAKLGFYPGFGNVSWLSALETWLGRSASYVVQFGDVRNTDAFLSSVWGEVVNAGAMQTISGRVNLVESVPLGFGNFVDTSTAGGRATAAATLQASANGSNDGAFRVAANYLKNGGYPDAVIRLGWEFDGGWMPWSSPGNEALWVQAYRHVHDVFRSVSPGFKFDWNGDSGYLQSQTAAYPGDNYVDVVGLDLYDKGMGGATAWNSSTKGWSDPNAAWASIVPNLVAQRAFAIAHGKPVSYPEWGLDGVNATATSNVGGDNPTFIQGMYNWMASLPASGAGSLMYQSYFNEDTADGNHKINAGWFPSASARYQALFSSSSTTSPPPPTTLPPPVIEPPATTTVPSATTTTVPRTVTTVPNTTPTTGVPTGAVLTQPPSQVIAAGTSAKNLSTESVWAGAKSPPYVCCWASQGQYVNFSFTAVSAQTTISLRYSAGNGNATRKVSLDGKVLVANQKFPATANWNTWSTVSIEKRFAAGPHNLEVWFDQPAGSGAFINLDRLTLTPTLIIKARTAARNVGTESVYPGAANAPYVCCWGSQGQFVTFSFNAVGGATNLALRYSAGNGAATRKIEIDGTVKTAAETFGRTGAWSAWSKVSLNATLTKGLHTLKIWFDQPAGSTNFLNLDNLSVKTG
jgi:hypothetical protein